jgi:tRNA(adenine34) deaminase
VSPVSDLDEKYMREALVCAEMAQREGLVPIGALCVYEGKIIARGMPNRHRPPEVSCAGYDVCYKSLVGRGAPGNLSGVTLYMTVEPSLLCISLCLSASVSKIVYGAEHSYGEPVGLSRKVQQLRQELAQQIPLYEGQCLAEESRILLDAFFKESRGIPPESVATVLTFRTR